MVAAGGSAVRSRQLSPIASAIVKVKEPLIIGRRIQPAKRRAAGARIGANIRRLQKTKSKRTATQALAEARGERLAR
jgi:hypothetical protein